MSYGHESFLLHSTKNNFSLVDLTCCWLRCRVVGVNETYLLDFLSCTFSLLHKVLMWWTLTAMLCYVSCLRVMWPSNLSVKYNQ